MVWVAFDRAVAGRRAARPRGPGGAVARPARRRCATRCSPRASTRGAAPSPSTTTPPRWTRHCWCCRRRLHHGDDPRMSATIEAIEEDLMRDGLLLRYRTSSRRRRSRGRRAPVPGVLVLAGLGVRPGRAGWTTPRPDAAAGRAGQRRRACSARSTTWRGRRMAGTSRRPTPTSPSSRPRARSPTPSAADASGPVRTGTGPVQQTPT